jgi:hypothetical protein
MRVARHCDEQKSTGLVRFHPARDSSLFAFHDFEVSGRFTPDAAAVAVSGESVVVHYPFHLFRLLSSDLHRTYAVHVNLNAGFGRSRGYGGTILRSKRDLPS